MEKDESHQDVEESLASLALALSSFSVPLGSNRSVETTKDIAWDTSAYNTKLQNFSSNIHSLIFPDFDDKFSDVLFYVSGHVVPLHRCILAVRCPFFKSLFDKNMTYLASLAPIDEPIDSQSSKLKIDFGRLFDTLPDVGRVSYEAFMNTMGFVYSGIQNISDVKCIDDDQCAHEACRPVVDFAIEMLGLTSALGIGDLKTSWQKYLHKIIEKADVDEVIPVLIAAKSHGADSLLSPCLHLVAISNLGSVHVEKQLPRALATEVLGLRRKMGLLLPQKLDPTYETECQRIRKALDSDDVELVHLLLEEGNVTLDQVHALHYAVLYCNPHTVRDMIELGLADLNIRDERGFTVLHVASMRRDFYILVTLLSNGAHPLETTPDGRTSLQLCRRSLRRPSTFSKKDCLCVRLLYQAGREDLIEGASAIFPPTVDEKELFNRLLYLENRIAIGRLLFPQETKLVAGICNLESTSEFVGFRCCEFPSVPRKEIEVDLNQIPPSHTPINKILTVSSSMPSPVMNEALLKRLDALQRTVMLGRRMFPCYVAIINSFTDDDDTLELFHASSEEQKRKKRHYCELEQALEGTFQKKLAAMENHKTNEPRSPT